MLIAKFKTSNHEGARVPLQFGDGHEGEMNECFNPEQPRN